MSRDIQANPANYLSAGDVPSVDLTGNAQTLAAWVRPDTTSGFTLALAKDNGAFGGCQYILGINGNVGYFQIGYASNQIGLQGSIGISAGVWTHILGIQFGGGLYIFTNGVANGSVSAGFLPQNTASPFLIGKRDNGSSFDGLIADAAIWDINLTQEELNALAKGVSPAMIRRPNLKGYWPLLGLNLATEADLCGAANAAQVGTVPASALRPQGGRWSAFAG